MKKMELLASFYDFLANLIFGSQIKRATAEFFNFINERDKVLIIGGGTGWILEQFQQSHLQVTYVDLSAEMINKARKRKFSFPVKFITGSYTSVPKDKYDIVITPFFLDMFSGNKLNDVIQHIMPHLRKKGIWLFSDFIPSNKIHHRVLVRIMYLFFSLFYDIEKYRLPDYDYWFNKRKLKLLKTEDSDNGLFTSRIYLMENEE